MKNADVKELYKLVPYGATVKITHENQVFRALKSGDIGSDVLEFQKDLKQLGYYKGSCNGKYEVNFKTSISKFQKDNKLYPSGSISRQTRNLILEYKNME